MAKESNVVDFFEAKAKKDFREFFTSLKEENVVATIEHTLASTLQDHNEEITFESLVEDSFSEEVLIEVLFLFLKDSRANDNNLVIGDLVWDPEENEVFKLLKPTEDI